MKDTGKTLAVLAALFAVFTAAMFGLNTVTGPIIESNNSSEAYDSFDGVVAVGCVENDGADESR